MLAAEGAAAVPPAAHPAPPQAATKPAAHRSGFHEFLSELNPLQYVPVLGTIYRSLTDDTIPEAARAFGSFLASGLFFGPMGLLTNAATLVAEKVTGIDVEKIGHELLADIGIGHHAGAAPAPAATPATQAPPDAAQIAAAQPWSPAQLRAYGITLEADGTPRRGALEGAEALNDAELSRLRGEHFA